MLASKNICEPIEGETILPDDYTVHGNYMYVFSSKDGIYNNAVWMNDLITGNVAQMRDDIESYLKIKVVEIKRCEIHKRQALDKK